MTPTIAVAIAVVIAGLLGVTGIFLHKTLAAEKQRRIATVIVRGIAFHFSFWNGVNDARLTKAFTLAVEKLLVVWPLMDLYKMLDGVHINVASAETWMEPWSQRMVAGQSSPSTKTVQVGPSFAALAHELAHIVEAGPGRQAPSEEHAGWTEKGIQAAIDSYEADLKSLA